MEEEKPGLAYVVEHAEEVLALEGAWRVTIWHEEEPLPGSFWRLFGGRRSDPERWQCWEGGLPEEGGRKGVSLPSAEELRQLFNARSEAVSTHTIPASLRGLVESGRITKSDAVKKVMDDDVPPGMEKPWKIWKQGKSGAQLAWENPRTGRPRQAANLSELIECFEARDERADAMRADFLEWFGVFTGIKDSELARAYIATGGCIEVCEYLGDGWVRARFSRSATTLSTDVYNGHRFGASGGGGGGGGGGDGGGGGGGDAAGSAYNIWLPLGYDETNSGDFGSADVDFQAHNMRHDGALDGRTWCQVIHVGASTTVWEVKEVLGKSSRPGRHRSYGGDGPGETFLSSLNLMLAGRLLVECKPGGLDGFPKSALHRLQAAEGDNGGEGEGKESEGERSEEEEETRGGDALGVSSLASKVRAIERTTALKKTLLLEVESRSGELAPVGPPRGVCYVCGQRTASPSALKWHIAKCLKRWKMDQDLLPHKMLRAKRPPPRPSLPVPNAPGPLLHAWNRQAALVYLLDCTPRCKGCGKAFATQQKVDAHMRSCCRDLIVAPPDKVPVELRLAALADQDSSEEKEEKNEDEVVELASGDALGSHPTVVCYICRRRTGLSSAAWHIKSCGERWLRRQADASLPEQLMRTTLPDGPTIALSSIGANSGGSGALGERDRALIRQYNAEATRIHDEQVLDRCPCCHVSIVDGSQRYRNRNACTERGKAAGGLGGETPGGGLVGGGGGLQEHMALCCPDVLEAMQDSVKPLSVTHRNGSQALVVSTSARTVSLTGGPDGFMIAPQTHPAERSQPQRRTDALAITDEQTDVVDDAEIQALIGTFNRTGLGAQCVVCGERFGLAGYGWHVSSCYRMWQRREKLKPPHKRRYHNVRFTGVVASGNSTAIATNPVTDIAVKKAAATLIEEKGRNLWRRQVARSLGLFPLDHEHQGLAAIGVHQVKVSLLTLNVVLECSREGNFDPRGEENGVTADESAGTAPVRPQRTRVAARQRLEMLQSDGSDEDRDAAAASTAVEDAISSAITEQMGNGEGDESWVVASLSLEIDARLVELRNRHVASALRFALEHAGADDQSDGNLARSSEGCGAGDGIGGQASALLLSAPVRLLRKAVTGALPSISSSSSSSSSSLSQLAVSIVRVPPPPPPGSRWGVGHPAKGWEATYSDTASATASAATTGNFDATRSTALVPTNPLNDWLPTKYDHKLVKFNAAVEELREHQKPFCPRCAAEDLESDEGQQERIGRPVRYENEEALAQHMAECCPEVLEVEKVLDQKMADKRDQPGRALSGHEHITCYLCGRRHVPNRKSFAFHLRSCIRSWQLSELTKPKAQRRLPPKLPSHVKLPRDLDWVAISRRAEAKCLARMLEMRREQQPGEETATTRSVSFADNDDDDDEGGADYLVADGAATMRLLGDSWATMLLLSDEERRAARAQGRAAATDAKEQLAAFNRHAESLFSRLGVLSCPKCSDDRRRVMRSIHSSGSTTTPPESRVFGNGAALVAHMKTCCPRDIPDGDLAHLERAEGPDALMSLIAGKRERERKRVAKVRAVKLERMQHKALEKAKLLDSQGGFLESREAMMAEDGELDARDQATVRTLAEVEVAFEEREAGLSELEKGDELDDTTLQRRTGVTCHICGQSVISAASLPMHLRACMQKWDNHERTHREPHRRRLFTWCKDDPKTWWDPGESYSLRDPDRPGRKQFAWDPMASPHATDPSLLETILNQNHRLASGAEPSSAASGPYRFHPPFRTSVALLARPRLRRVPGPVPAPPRRYVLPLEAQTAETTASVAESDRAYNRRVGLYNEEARRIAEDWRPQCVNHRPVALVLRGVAALERIREVHGDAHGFAPGEGDGFSDGKRVLRLLGLSLKNDATLAVTSYSTAAAVVDRVVDVANQNEAATLVAGDKLWSVSFLGKRLRRAAQVFPTAGPAVVEDDDGAPPMRPSWATWRFHTQDEEESGDLLADAAAKALEVFKQEAADGESEDAVEEPTLVLLFRRGCDKRFALQSKLETHMETCCPDALAALRKMDREVPDPRKDAPVNVDDLPGTVCFVCSKRVQYMGSLPAHTSRCFAKNEAFEAVKPKHLREPPPRPPEHVYGRAAEKRVQVRGATAESFLQLRQDSALRVTVTRYKAGHTFESSLQEWKYDVNFVFFAVLHVSSSETVTALRNAFKGIRLRRSRPTIGTSQDDSTWVLVVERSDGEQQHKRHPTLPLSVGDEIVVTAPVTDAALVSMKDVQGVSGDGTTEEKLSADLLDVRWGSSPGAAAGCGPTVSCRAAKVALLGTKGDGCESDEDESFFQDMQDEDEENEATIADLFSGEQPFTVRVRRRLEGSANEKSLMPCMRLALAEWDRRCEAVFQNKQPRCGKRIALQRTLMENQLDDIRFQYTSRRGLEVAAFLEDDEGALLPGDELSVYGSPGVPRSQLKLAHGVHPQVLRQALVNLCRKDAEKRGLVGGSHETEGEVTLHLVRTILRPAYSVAAKGNAEVAKWAEELGYSGRRKQELDGMKASELYDKLLALKACGFDIQVEEGEERVQMRTKLQEALKGGCGRVFSNQISVFKHMCQCCADVIDDSTKELFAEDPMEAAARTLAVQSDAGLEGSNLDVAKWPLGEPGWVCYLCNQRTFTLESFKFHLRTCERNWDNNELQKHPTKRRPRPRPPKGSHGTSRKHIDDVAEETLDDDDADGGESLFGRVLNDGFDLIPDKYGPELKAYNDEAFAILAANQSCCPNCAKTFGSDLSLERHMSQCCPAILEAERARETADRDPIGHDTSIVCYLCGGRTVSLQSLPTHLKACRRRYFHRENGKPVSKRIWPPNPPELPVPTTKAEVSAYNQQAQAIFEEKMPRCENNFRFPLQVSRTLVEALIGDGNNSDDDDDGVQSKLSSVASEQLLGSDAGNGHKIAVIGKVPREVYKKTGVRRGDVLLCIQEQEATADDDGYRLVNAADDEAAEGQQSVRAVMERLSDCLVLSEQLVKQNRPPLSVWWFRRCGASFAEESKLEKHQKGCWRDLIKGVPELPGTGDEDTSLESLVSPVDLSVYGGVQCPPVKVRGDVHSLHAKGARERLAADKQIQKENERIQRQLAATYKTTGAVDPHTGKFRVASRPHVRSRLELRHWNEARRVGAENRRLGHAMRWLYGRTNDPVDETYGGVQNNAIRVTRYYEGYAKSSNRRNVLPDWDLRTHVYLAGDGYTNNDHYEPFGQPEVGMPHTRRPVDMKKKAKTTTETTTTVPKTQGVTQCAGCGNRSFFKADGGQMRRCQRVAIPELSQWLQERTAAGQQIDIACKLLGLNEKAPFFGGACSAAGAGNGSGKVAGMGAADDCPWYCDDACALAGWMDHARVCAHSTKGTGHGGLAAVVDAPWIMRGNFIGGTPGIARRFLNRQKVTVRYPSGQTEEIRSLSLLVPPVRRTGSSRHGEEEEKEGQTTTSAWTVREGERARIKRFDARGKERLVSVFIDKVQKKPGIRQLLEHIGKQVKSDPELMGMIGAADPIDDGEEGVKQIGLACFFCGDKCDNTVTYEAHVRVCERRWLRMEQRKPVGSKRRAKPVRPNLPKPSDLNNQEEVLKYNDAAKEAQGPDDGNNPNGGGAIAASLRADKRADGKAAKEQLNIALHTMDLQVNQQIRDLDRLTKRLAWEKGGTGVLENSKGPSARLKGKSGKKLAQTQGDGRGTQNQPYPGDYDFDYFGKNDHTVTPVEGLMGSARYDIGDARRRAGPDDPPPPRHASNDMALRRAVAGAEERRWIQRPTTVASEIGRGVVDARGGGSTTTYTRRKEEDVSKENGPVVSQDIGREIVKANGAVERATAAGIFPNGGASREVPTLIGHRFVEENTSVAPVSGLRPQYRQPKTTQKGVLRQQQQQRKPIPTGIWGDEPTAAGGEQRRFY